MKSIITFALSLSLLAVWVLGCATAPKTQWFWVKPGGTNDALNKDVYACTQESQQRVSESTYQRRVGSSSSVVQTNVELYNLCMQARGWVLEADSYGFEPKATKEQKKKKVKNQSRIIATDDRFIAYENGTVQDTSTNLMWAAKDNGSNIDWSDAKEYCENYRGGGYTDWRMPTQDELATLYDANQSTPNPRYPRENLHVATKLIDITSERFWASEGGKNFNFTEGEKQGNFKFMALTHRALPVR